MDAAKELVRLAREQGLSLTGPDGLLKQLTKTVLEAALNEELTEHLGYGKHDPVGKETGNVRNGTRSNTVLTEASGHVEIVVPRDRAGTFEPQIVLSLYAKGLTTGEISAHFAEIYGASVSKETVSRITDKVIKEMQDWAVRPLDGVYAAVFIDAIVVKVREGQVANRPIYAAIGVTLEGEKDILGLWAGAGGEGGGTGICSLCRIDAAASPFLSSDRFVVLVVRRRFARRHLENSGVKKGCGWQGFSCGSSRAGRSRYRSNRLIRCGSRLSVLMRS
jgi:hypothetical protein